MPKSTLITLTIGLLVCALWIIMYSARAAEAATPAIGAISHKGLLALDFPEIE